MPGAGMAREHAGRVGTAGAHDVKRRAMGHARPHQRQAQRDVDRLVHPQHLHGDVALIMVERDDAGEFPAKRPGEERVGRQGTSHGHARPCELLDRRGNDAGLLVTEQASLTAVGIEGRHGDAWAFATQP